MLNKYCLLVFSGRINLRKARTIELYHLNNLEETGSGSWNYQKFQLKSYSGTLIFAYRGFKSGNLHLLKKSQLTANKADALFYKRSANWKIRKGNNAYDFSFLELIDLLETNLDLFASDGVNGLNSLLKAVSDAQGLCLPEEFVVYGSFGNQVCPGERGK